ncbi:right-handed parallel beta-helix repeat-containing protein [Marivita sp. S2033]|uniref:right-handed parallel beta-helix repeat-containing protein n=1 Tax=Marivita sp. S2033 TaxID=3373187 RepID=UPI003982B232
MPQYDNVIENQVLSSTLRLVGSQWDNTIVRNVIIEDVNGDGAMLRDVKNVTFENVTIRNVSGDGIKLSTMGSTSNVVIKDSTITQIGEDGINAGQRYSEGVDHPGLQIIDNTIDGTGLNGSKGGLLHGIYVQSTDFHIEGNRVTNSYDGNGISVRSWGVVCDNEVDNSTDSGIAYFADHMGRNGSLLIERNTVTDSGYSRGRSDVDLLSVPNKSNLVDDITVRDNNLERGTEIGRGYDNCPIYIDSAAGSPPVTSPPPVTPQPPIGGSNGNPIEGDGSDNVIRGDAGNNNMTGRSGADVFVFERNGGSDTILDFDPGVDSIAVHGFNGVTSANDLVPRASEQGGHTVILMGTGERLVIANTEMSDLSAKDFVFNFDVDSGGSEPPAGGGNTGVDVVGDRGDNTIRGDAQDNSMFGLAGADVFVFEKNGGTDTVEDFNLGADRIVLYGFNDLTSVSALASAATERAGDTILTSDTGDVLIIANTEISDFGAHHFMFI